MNLSRRLSGAVPHLLPFLLVLASLTPLIWMVGTSFKGRMEIYAGGLNPVPELATRENYIRVLERLPLLRYYFNTFLVAAIVTVGLLFISLLAAYGFTRFNFRGRDTLFYLCLISIFVPVQVTMLPNYLLVAQLGWLNSFAGLTMPLMANALGIFLLRQAMRTIPRSLFEAALLDGATDLTILRRIALPILKPTMAALAAMFFINSWNEYYWPLLVVNDREMYTLPLALQMFTSAEGGTAWGAMMAAATLTMLPPFLIYIFTQRYVIASFVKSGIKG